MCFKGIAQSLQREVSMSQSMAYLSRHRQQIFFIIGNLFKPRLHKQFEHVQRIFMSDATKKSKAMATSDEQLQTQSQTTSYRKYLIVGLGNHDLPDTRHSVGMRMVNKMAAALGVTWKKELKTCGGFVASCDISSNTHLVLLRPKLAMNVNGSSVAKAARFHGVQTSNIYLIHDDLDRKVGKVSIKERGSASGHNGVRSVISSMRTEEIPRVRIGIDRPTTKQEVFHYVLTKFQREEQTIINQAIAEGIHQLTCHMAKRGADVEAMTRLQSSGG